MNAFRLFGTSASIFITLEAVLNLHVRPVADFLIGLGQGLQNLGRFQRGARHLAECPGQLFSVARQIDCDRRGAS